jgi:tetratricopeptide (TPR) repeat protein
MPWGTGRWLALLPLQFQTLNHEMTTMRVLKQWITVMALGGLLSSCATSTKTIVIKKPLAVTPSEGSLDNKVLRDTPPAKTVLKKVPRRVPETDPRLAVKARKKIKRAQKLYAIGEYDQAEALLKESITLFPFLAQAQLTLGKIFLLKGSAARDMALLNSARLMFEMAGAIDPGQAEIQTLLELFTVRYPE